MNKKITPPNNNNVSKSKIRFPEYNKETFHSELVKFSFKYLNIKTEPYLIDNQDTNYFIKFIERMINVSSMTCESLKYPKVKALRNHFINWNDTTQASFGLPNEEQLVDKPFQFGISANEHGRLIGFFIVNTFYIVWFDCHHNTYS